MTGFICVDKAEGVSSAREVAAIKKLAGIPCGHMGTLDPMASGVLPVAIGNAARLFDYFLKKRKVYYARFLFGADSDTLDVCGNMVLGGRIPTFEEIQAILPQFTGEIMQIPPRYSAKNIDGKRGYQLAREGVEFTLPAKQVTVYSINLVKGLANGEYAFIIECGGGTYIRSLARDIAEKLKTHAVMSGLRRTQSGVFTIEKSVKTTDLTAENFKNYLIKTDEVIDFEAVFADEKSAKRLFNGLAVDCDRADGIYKIYEPDGNFYGLGQVIQQKLKVKTKLC